MVNCFKVSHLIIPSHPLHLSPECTWTCSIALRYLIWSVFIPLQLVCYNAQFLKDLSSDHPIPSSSSVSSQYVNLLNCFKISYLIIPSHSLHLSPASTWTSSIALRYLIWSVFICLQLVRELAQLLKISHLIIPSHPLHLSSASTWACSIALRSLIWSFFIRLAQLLYDLSSDHPIHPFHSSPARTWTCSISLRYLIWSSHSILFIHQ